MLNARIINLAHTSIHYTSLTMPHRYPALLPLLLVLISVGLTAYVSGPAASQGRGYTGAPGETAIKCSTCHNSGPYGTPQLSLLLDDATAEAYVPGRTYRVSVAVTASSGTPAGYGFQAQVLTDAAEPLTAGTLAQPDATSHITALDNGRVYVEHDRADEDGMWTFDWTAPEAGTGPVKIYLVGNTVNDNGSSGGDNGSSEPLITTLAEAEETTAVFPSVTTTRAIAAFPNPVAEATTLTLESPSAGPATVTLLAADGRVLTENLRTLTAGTNRWTLSLADRPAGTYRLLVTTPGARYAVTLLRP